ncbi:restriction endonuclease subunit S [Metamycoplasma hyosynoviae]|uniref:restriction endonuclease subunit S n=3 Tax=Metamycoplasma hyosynoviae TaxID=29559 RepID=UPI0023595591|nr:restriction endonuclease subunit S [Metamycoplasma hyosynoviae]MDC8912540.1 restriction endonuclease subunit S [Metamycoplasma hyosynoviae]
MKLSEITSIITDYVANGSFASLRENAKYVSKEKGYARVIRLTDENNHYSLEDAIFVNYESYCFLSKSKLDSGDIIVTNVGAYLGTVFQCPNLNIPMTLGPNAILIKPNNLVINKYLYYLLNSNYGHRKLLSLISGSAMPKFNKTDLKNLNISIHNKSLQHHIVNTIGSVDNLIENLTKQNEILMTLGISKINQFNNSYEKKSLNKIVKFEKGFEVGSSKYIEIYKKGLINYLRVGDLLSLSNTYIDEKDSDKIAKFEDILVAFDGSPGRNSIGLVGAYSSGIYNLKSTNNDKGLVYFEMNSDINKKIIDNHSQGTTILHASKSINYLVYVDVDDNDKKVLNNYFYLILQNKKKINFLNKIKDNLLNKYF